MKFFGSRTQSILGMDLQTHCLQMATSNNPTIVTVPLLANLFSEGILKQAVQFREQVAPYLEKRHFHQVILNIPSQWVNCYFLPIKIRGLNTQELETMIDFELEQRLHQRKEHFYRDYILQNESDSLTAFVVICPKDIMTSRLTALKLLDLRPTQVTTTYSMMARLLFKKMPLGTGAVIHIEAHCANLLVIAQQQIIYVETVARLEDCLNTTIALLLTALQQHNVQIEEILLTGCEQLAAQELQQLTNDHSYRLSAADQDWTVASQLIEPATS